MANFYFKPDQPELSTLLEQIQCGELQLPDFQRDWVWDDDRIADLLASVSLGWPVGAVLLLEVGGEVRFKARHFEGSPEAKGRERRLVLDGQQRLTSLYLALRSGKPVRTVDRRQKKVERIYYFDIKRALDPDLDRVEAILSLSPTKQIRSDFNRVVDLDLSSTDLEYEHFCIPATVAFNSGQTREWRRGLNEKHEHAREVSELWDEFEANVVTALQNYRLPAIELGRDTSRAAVCMVFEKVNTGGKALDVFELVTASFASDDFDLREDWEARAKRLSKRAVLKSVTSAEFLQAVALAASYSRSIKEGKGAVGCRRTDVLKMELDAYQQHADAVEKGFVRAAQVLDRECIFGSDYLPYPSQLIPLSAIASNLGPLFLEEPTRGKILRWYWSGVFGELYGGTTETRFARDMVEVPAWLEGGSEPSTIRDSSFSPTRLLSLRTKNSAAYKGFMALLLQVGARDFFQGDEIERSRYFDDRVDIHHVFPQKWCKDQKLEKGRYNCILNKTPLTARTNKRLGGIAPSRYLDLVKRTGVGELESILDSHLLHHGTLLSDDFDGFLRERARCFLDRVEKATGKSVPGRDAEDVIESFGALLAPLESEKTSNQAVERLFSKYKILEKLPSGGMSEGYKVQAKDGSVLFIKKVPTTGVSADAMRRELDIYSRLQRAGATNVLEIHDFERGENEIALVMEFAADGSLADFKDNSPPLSVLDAKDIALEVLAGLRELHSLEIVHRDLKPENVFRVSGQWKLGDFGISKSLARLGTQGRTFQGHGTPGFAPPEQIDGAEAHPSADIYAFGKLLAYLLCGQTDVDQIRFPSWAQLARSCTERVADKRPDLDGIETEIAGIPT